MGSFFGPPRRGLFVLFAMVLAASGSIAFAALLPTADAAIPQHPAWKSTARLGIWHNHGFDVYNNEWNTDEAGPQTIWANSHQHWGVESTQPNTSSVKTYPSVQKNFDDRPYTSFRRLTSTYAESMPDAALNFDAEAAYDIWLNNYNVEVMLWVDNHGQTPAGHVIAGVHICGQRFAVWQDGHDMYSFVLSGRQESSGQVNLLKALRWLVNHGYLSRSDTVTQVDFGWEIASTQGIPMNFTMTHYTLSAG
jgi:hypothetical protein